MVYENFFKSEWQQVKICPNKEDGGSRLLMAVGANAAVQRGEELICGEMLDFDLDETLLIWHLHDSLSKKMSEKQLRNTIWRLAEKAEAKNIENVYYILPFLSYFETRWNDQKGYGDLVILAAAIGEQNNPQKLIAGGQLEQLGDFMAAAAECYEEMTEEAYDQRELFADFLRNCAVSYRMAEYLDREGTLESVMIAYALLKGIRLGVLCKDVYGEIAKRILLAAETEGFICSQGRVRLKHEEGNKKKVLACMLAYSEYLKLRKEYSYYGI